MLYKIEYLDDVYDQLAAIPRNIRESIVRAINERLTITPYRFKPLVCNWKGYFRMRVGDYRVIYRFEDEKVTVVIVRAAARGNVYG